MRTTSLVHLIFLNLNTLIYQVKVHVTKTLPHYVLFSQVAIFTIRTYGRAVSWCQGSTQHGSYPHYRPLCGKLILRAY
jgi:hypothetical protein